jgi:hypothetical protein
MLLWMARIFFKSMDQANPLASPIKVASPNEYKMCPARASIRIPPDFFASMKPRTRMMQRTSVIAVSRIRMTLGPLDIFRCRIMEMITEGDVLPNIAPRSMERLNPNPVAIWTRYPVTTTVVKKAGKIRLKPDFQFSLMTLYRVSRPPSKSMMAKVIWTKTGPTFPK